MPRKLLPLAFALALGAAACSQPPNPQVEFGSGERFVPMVADSLNDSGVEPSVAVTQDGLPMVAYFAFEEKTVEGEQPEARPVGAPTIPGVLMATVNAEGIWTRGAIALEAEIPNVQVPFNPGFDPSVAHLTAQNVTGLQLVVEGDAFDAVWASAGGLYYATGSTDPSSAEQVEISKVTGKPAVGPSIAIAGGTPRIAYYTSRSSFASVELATQSGGGWTTETVAEAGGCDTCTTAVVATGNGPAVAYSDAGNGVSIATADGANGWEAQGLGGGGGQGLAGTATDDGLALSFYDGGRVMVANGRSGSFQTNAVSEVGEGSAEKDGARTSIAADEAGTLWVAWSDAAEGVRFASGDGESFTPVDTGADTANASMPAVAVTPDGATAYLAWYDTQHQDMLLAAYGDVEGLAVAQPSPEPTGGAAPTAPPSGGECAAPAGGTIEITARGIAFDTPCVNVPAGEPVTIAFDNEDAGTQHNVQIYPNSDQVSADAALTQNDVITGPDTVDYPVDPLDAGTYYFQCDVHPTMNGVWNVAAAGGGGGGGGGGGEGGSGGGQGGGGGGGAAVTVTAQNIAFDTDTIELPADTESTITFDNQDAGTQHNIAIFTDESLSENVFRGQLVTGPDTVDYTVPPLEAGDYYFHCDVHPTMSGTVTVG